MRLWSLHPKYLDAQGLVALWREGLLAQKVLQGRTKGYRHHPQLRRFREARSPLSAIRRYLLEVQKEAVTRGYSFDRKKLGKNIPRAPKIPVTAGQLRYERDHLRRKLRRRDPARLKILKGRILPHPSFRAVRGGSRIGKRPYNVR